MGDRFEWTQKCPKCGVDIEVWYAESCGITTITCRKCLTLFDIVMGFRLVESSGEQPAPLPKIEEAMVTLHEAAYDGLCYKYHAKDKVEWWDAVLKAEALIKAALSKPAPPAKTVTGQEKVLSRVTLERRRQDDKWGIQNHGPDGWLAILMEEVGEVAKALLEGDPGDYRKELIQVAAVAVAALECIDRGNVEIGSLVKAQQELKKLRDLGIVVEGGEGEK